MSKAWIFDFDGTLVHSEAAITQCFESITKKLAPHRLDFAKDILIGPPLRQTVAEILGDPGHPLIDEFVSAYMQGNPPGFANVGSQARFLEPRPNGTSVDRLFRYEDQAGLLAFLEGRLDMRIELPRRNVSPEMDLDLSPDVERRLRRKCSDEFALWEAIPPGEA